MLNLNKEASQLENDKIELGTCLICGAYVSHLYFMKDSVSHKTSKWYSCSCGIVWNTTKPCMIYDKKYWDKYDQFDNKLRDSYEYVVRIYAPIIEELIYGRKVLIIGRTTNHQENYFKYRGWIPTVIDRNTSFKPTDALIVDDFETYEFNPKTKFSLIWLYQTLECFTNPVKSLEKLTELLTEDGILFIGSPDTDFIHTRGSSGFIHWKPDMHYLMWNKRSISSHLEKLGFSIIMCRRNYEHRFPAWDDFHLIAQRKFF